MCRVTEAFIAMPRCGITRGGVVHYMCTCGDRVEIANVAIALWQGAGANEQCHVLTYHMHATREPVSNL